MNLSSYSCDELHVFHTMIVSINTLINLSVIESEEREQRESLVWRDTYSYSISS